MEHVPVVNMPMLNTLLAPTLERFLPKMGETMNTVSSKMPKTRPYSVAVAPFFSASEIFHTFRSSNSHVLVICLLNKTYHGDKMVLGGKHKSRCKNLPQQTQKVSTIVFY